jgi:hypothetical protein
MTDQERSQERARQETREQPPAPQAQQQQQRTREAEQQRQAEQPQPQPNAAQQVESGKKSSFKAGQATVTLGRAGEHNLAIEWIDVDLATYMSARFDIRTAPGNALEIQVEQNLYKKNYSGSGSISTTVLPGAPTGTTGKLTARDIISGEMLEVPWIWYNMGGVRGPGLWATIKRLIWKSGA